MTSTVWIEDVLKGLAKARVAVFGDFCLDAYWTLVAGDAPLSLETGLPIRRVRSQRYSLGGAGNVAANLAALGVDAIYAVGPVGDDLFGLEVRRLLALAGVDTEALLTVSAPWQTMMYAKPYLADVEESRLDFGTADRLPDEAIQTLLAMLDRVAAISNVVILNQQVTVDAQQGENAGASKSIVDRINQIIERHPRTRFIVDARDQAGGYRGAMLKLNAHEASRLLDSAKPLESAIGFEEASSLAQRLFARTGQPVFLTRGEFGLIAADRNGVYEIPGVQSTALIDPVGAGDTVVAALAAVLGAGGDHVTAARVANLAASITVRKIQQTGTASPAEIRSAAVDTDFVYSPDLAGNARQARYLDGTEIEIIRPLPENLRIRHAIFDHDGTLSTLREGWELIMQPMMERAVLGPRFHNADPALYRTIQDSVRAFIDKTTGIQTLVQMQGLAQLVRQFGFVASADVLDEHGYKKIYNDQLLAMVIGRVRKLQKGELASGDFQIKNAEPLLRRLHAKGIKLYLASGTDEADVITEATAMGYADLFEGRIYGAVGDVKVEAKKVVLERIMRENNLAGHEFVVFGDGPVEMREARKRDGVAIGICSDEVRRFGHNPAKRSRLIRGGAGLLVPDFSQMEFLLDLLNIH